MKIEGVRAIGFDLDGTLYLSTPQMDDRIRTRISQHILERCPQFKSIQAARSAFEERYQNLHGGGAVLRSFGFDDYDAVMEESLATADITDLIAPNPILAKTLLDFKQIFEVNLITSSPETRANNILSCIGIDFSLFTNRVYCTTREAGDKRSGDSFRYVLQRSAFPAANHLYIGDREKSDILPAKSLGMKTASVWKPISSADYYFPEINNVRCLLE